MDLFISLALLMALAILLSAWQRDKIADAAEFQKAVKFFVAAILVHDPLVELIMAFHPPVVLMVFGRIISYVLLLISFYALCRAWGAPLLGPDDQQSSRPSL